MKILPPHLFYGSIALIVAVNLLFGGFHPVTSPWNWGIGLVLVVLGLAMNLPSAGLFRTIKTNLIPYNDPNVLVTSGWFRFTRNPMYLGFVAILLGVATGAGSIYGYVVPLLFGVIMDRTFVRFEEQAMARVFGPAYEDYRCKVRRWI
jgi:protein-S-isoprenylcysteine O-methyltransferase Ste14